MFKLLVIVALVGAVYTQNTSLPTVDLGYEIHRASNFNETGRFFNFSNIRYAAPPLGNLRFAVPKAPEQNRGSTQNGTTGRICPQGSPLWSAQAGEYARSFFAGRNVTVPPYTPTGANVSSIVPPPGPLENEDCLFLDVFVPESIFQQAESGYGAPVLVWIYGGGYALGSKYNNPAGLFAASGNVSSGEVIYVAMNYRLGALGWLSGPSYASEGGESNLGLYDQRFALEWIQQYIHLFGGDKNRVTVFGESAGGGSIMHQITAYGGLKGKVPFQQAIPQSPGFQILQSQLYQETVYQRMLNLTNTTSLTQLRQLPSSAIIRANAQDIAYNANWGSYVYSPVVDGKFVPLLPGQLLARGQFDQSLRIMVGHNANEGFLFTPPYITTEDGFAQQIRIYFPNIVESSVQYILNTLYPPVFDGSYGYRTYFERAALLTGEVIFTCNTNYLATAFKNKPYSYLFSIPPALHGQDVPYSYYDGGALSSTVRNRTIALALQDFITSFTKTGKPVADGIQPFNMYGPNSQLLNLNGTGVSQIVDSNASDKCRWFQLSLYN